MLEYAILLVSAELVNVFPHDEHLYSLSEPPPLQEPIPANINIMTIIISAVLPFPPPLLPAALSSPLLFIQ